MLLRKREESWENKEKQFITCVDMKKAYNSVLKKALLRVLRNG